MRDPDLPVDPDELAAHTDRLRALVRRLVADPGRVDDIVQEANLVALARPRRASVPLYAWLAGVAHNIVRHDRRSAARRRRHEVAAARPGAAPSAADVVERAEFARTLVDQLVSMEEPYRRTLLMRYFDGLEPREIAERAGIPASTVRSHLKRGLELLRQRLDARHGGDRSAWLAVCAPFVADVRTPAPFPASAGGTTTATGVVLMASTRTVSAAVAVLVLVAGATWIATQSPPGESARASVVVGAELPPAPARSRVRAADAPPQSPDAGAARDVGSSADAGRVVGRVLLPDGTPAAGAAVRLSARKSAWVKTDRDGRFALDTSSAGDLVSVWVVAAGFRSVPVPVFDVPRDAAVTLPAIRLEADAEVVIHGVARSSANRSLEGGRVKLMWATGTAADALTQASDPGLYEIVANASRPDEPSPPAAVARIRDRSAVIGTDGRFALSVPAALRRACLMASAPGHMTAWGKPFRLADVAGTNIELVLNPLPRARGQVVDAISGTPVAGAGVGFFLRDREPPPSRTDSAGCFDVEAREGAGGFALNVVAEGYVAAAAERFGDDTPLRIAIWPARSITGRVELADGTPVADAYIHARTSLPGPHGAPPTGGEYADARGVFTLERLTDVTYSLTVSMGDRARTSFQERRVDAVRGGTTDVRIVVDAALAVSGRVVDPAGVGVKGVLVWAIREGVYSTMERTDDHGLFVLRGLTAGSYTVQVADIGATAGGWLPTEQPDVAAGTTGLALVVRRGETIRGVVVDDDGHAVAGRHVVAADADADPFLTGNLGQKALTDGEGRFTLVGLPTGDVRIQMDSEHASFDPRWWLIGGERIRSGSRDVRLVLTHGASISGVVVDASGAPIVKSGVWALWTPTASGGRQALTDDLGRFEIRWLPPGRTYTIASVNGRVREVAAGTRDLRLAPQK